MLSWVMILRRLMQCGNDDFWVASESDDERTGGVTR